MSGVRLRRRARVLHLILNCLRVAFGSLLVCQRRGGGGAVAVVQGVGADRAVKKNVKNGQYKQKQKRAIGKENEGQEQHTRPRRRRTSGIKKRCSAPSAAADFPDFVNADMIRRSIKPLAAHLAERRACFLLKNTRRRVWGCRCLALYNNCPRS